MRILKNSSEEACIGAGCLEDAAGAVNVDTTARPRALMMEKPEAALKGHARNFLDGIGGYARIEPSTAQIRTPIGIQVEGAPRRSLDAIAPVMAEAFNLSRGEENEVTHERLMDLAAQMSGIVEIALIDVVDVVHGLLSEEEQTPPQTGWCPSGVV